MPYLVKGNAEQLFNAFGQPWAVAEGKDETGTIQLDFPRTHFIGSNDQAITHFNIWDKEALKKYYLQGNMSAANLSCLLGPNPLMKVDEDPEIYHQNCIRQHFAYINEAGETSGLMLVYRKDDPKQWMIGLVKNGHAAPKDRELMFLSSFDLAPFIPSPESGVTVSSVGLHDNPLMQEIGAALPKELLQNAFKGDNDEINLRVQRIDLLMRHLNVEQEAVQLNDPITFSELNLPALFADSPALDFFVQYQSEDFSLSFALLKELLSDASVLRKEIEAIKPSSDTQINKSLLKILVTFYENGLLEKNRQLLNNLTFVKTFSGFMWDKLQINLIPFLIQKKYDDDLIRLILSEPAYFDAISKLVNLESALIQDVPQFFKDESKRKELEYIYTIPNEECKLLCLIFWVKGSLSIDGYQRIVEATQKYPLLASTLIALDSTKTITIEALGNLALKPKEHLPQSFAHHYAEELKVLRGEPVKLSKTKDLEAASVSLMLLKKAGITEPKLYQLILRKDNDGQILRLILPQLIGITDKHFRKSLIDVVYAGVRHGIQTQGNKVLAIKDPEQLAKAQSLRERFICVRQMQDLGFKDELIELAAEENTKEAQRFRHIILRVEAQCKIIYERLLSSESYKDTLNKWKAEEEHYRKALYSIAYSGLIDPDQDFRAKLQIAEQRMLDIVDPKIDTYLYNALIVLANIVIFALSLSIANAIKYSQTGNYWFFNQTPSGEEIRALDKEVCKQIEQEKDQEMVDSPIVTVH